MTEQPKIIERVRKLLELAADSAATPGEAAAAMGRAQHLIDQHHIDRAELQARAGRDAGSQAKRGTHVRQVELLRRARLDRWDYSLAEAVAEVTGCRLYGLGRRRVLIAYGLPVDAAVAAELFPWVRGRMQRAVREWAREERGAGRAVKTSGAAARSFRDGFCMELLGQLYADKREAGAAPRAAQAQSAAVVIRQQLMVRRDNALAEFEASSGLALARAKIMLPACVRVGCVDGASYADGRQAAAEVSLSRNVVPS